MSRSRRNLHRYAAFAGAVIVGAAISLVVPPGIGPLAREVAGYDAGVIVLLAFFWLHTMHADGATTRSRAALEDPGRNFILFIVLGAALVGLISAIRIIGYGPHTHTGFERWIAYGLGVTAVIGGWFLVHTVYTFRYAHLFWYDLDNDGKPGGVVFPQTEEPSDWDFAYLAFCIGASFAVSDPQITATLIRREIMWHSIISFGYNSIIIGLVINLFAGIFGGH